MKKALVVIANDNILDVPLFLVEDYDTYHYLLLNEFFKNYHLPYFASPYNYENVFKRLLEEGFIIIEIVGDDTALCWFNLPVTCKQLESLKSYRDYLSSFAYF
ncbi:MAG: hypothetical protein NC483_01455 [Ruminococcus sp.]|nr:hypothetical protein [Ruminococcus sp.]